MTTLEQRLERPFQNEELLRQAFTHKSFHNENPGLSPGHNERFEFLGDAVLDLALSDILMREFPDFSEGELSKIRASLVNESVLAEVAVQCGHDKKLRLGKGEMMTNGASKPRLLASVFEAYVGACFLDRGFDEARELVSEIFLPRIKAVNREVHFLQDYKTRLQERLQELHRQAPSYVVRSESGPDHEKTFEVEVLLNAEPLAQGTGKSKKQAEQDAARKALETLK